MSASAAWTQSYSHDIDATPQIIWQALSDVSSWKVWNPGVRSIQIEGSFVTGTWFSMELPDHEIIRSQLVEVSAPQRFIDETMFGDTLIRVEHRIDVLAAGRCSVVYAVSVQGGDAEAIGEAVSADFPDVLAGLERYVLSVPTGNQRIVLARYLEGELDDSHFRFETAPLPELTSGQVLLKTKFLSLDPYVRNRMTNQKSYSAGLAPGDVIIGETVAEVVESENAAFKVGDTVLSWAGWQTYSISDGSNLRLLPTTDVPASLYLGVLGMPGLTAYVGLQEIGQPKPGETVVVAAATGPVGSAVGQIARIRGARAVGVAGGEAKCRRLIEDYGFDAAVDHRAPDFAEQLRNACPNGIDVYFDSVGGHVLSAVIPLLNDFSRIPLCGTIADYNAPGSALGPDSRPAFVRALLVHRVTVRGFIVYDFADRQAEFERDMAEWVRSGAVKYRESVASGLGAAPAAFMGMLKGHNDGKVIVGFE